MNRDPVVMEHFVEPYGRTRSDRLLDRVAELWDENGWGLWVLERLDTGEVVGFTGLAPADFEAPFTPAVEVGWRLAREHWGHGFASEAAREALRVAFDELALRRGRLLHRRRQRPAPGPSWSGSGCAATPTGTSSTRPSRRGTGSARTCSTASAPTTGAGSRPEPPVSPGAAPGARGRRRPPRPAGQPAAAPGSTSFERRRPEPTTTHGWATTAASTSRGHAAGRPTGVMPPNSMPLASTAVSIGANDALRASSRRRTRPLTSARVVASTTHAARVVVSPAAAGDDDAVGRLLEGHAVAPRRTRRCPRGRGRSRPRARSSSPGRLQRLPDRVRQQVRAAPGPGRWRGCRARCLSRPGAASGPARRRRRGGTARARGPTPRPAPARAGAGPRPGR